MSEKTKRTLCFRQNSRTASKDKGDALDLVTHPAVFQAKLAPKGAKTKRAREQRLCSIEEVFEDDGGLVSKLRAALRGGRSGGRGVRDLRQSAPTDILPAQSSKLLLC